MQSDQRDPVAVHTRPTGCTYQRELMAIRPFSAAALYQDRDPPSIGTRCNREIAIPAMFGCHRGRRALARFYPC